MDEQQKKQRLQKLCLMLVGFMLGGAVISTGIQVVWSSAGKMLSDSRAQKNETLITLEKASEPVSEARQNSGRQSVNNSAGSSLSDEQTVQRPPGSVDEREIARGNSSNDGQNIFQEVAFPQSVCGDPSPQKPFYRIYVTNSNMLSRVRSRYCQDSYMEGNRVKVATFDTADRANAFRRYLSEELRTEVEVDVVN